MQQSVRAVPSCSERSHPFSEVSTITRGRGEQNYALLSSPSKIEGRSSQFHISCDYWPSASFTSIRTAPSPSGNPKKLLHLEFNTEPQGPSGNGRLPFSLLCALCSLHSPALV
ncbi:hypothetical protein TraAM80_06934 [Trypanosoma rangeli]|uniref:Uncharacterized protein n=1 Tax=Trypanosoma rangeli TaxID=5698 RepID=A0A422N837_TRYRA|nr:uncharacterized protein TraAM80_06934 [Trypanosoma rangeli]RNF01620.1 hypothetical protein TraAM80_06934 [Trypanosoma rangeli]|eukprot:RNF01620.1 hypothetical protein TraAM80_06934 [Trypanosoma rangeli]